MRIPSLPLLALLAGGAGLLSMPARPSPTLPAPSPLARVAPELETDAPPAPPQKKKKGKKGGPIPGVYKDVVRPEWFDNDDRLWYRNDLRDKTREFILVDAAKGQRGPAFDHAKLAAALSKAAGAEYRADRLPFDRIEFADGAKTVRFRVGATTWQCDLSSYEVTRAAVPMKEAPPEAPARAEVEQEQAESPFPDGLAPDEGEQPVLFQPPPVRRGVDSPDGKWTAFVRDSNVFVGPRGGKAKQLSTDGKDGLAYERLEWSPDSKALVAFRVEPGDNKEVHLIRSSPSGGGRARLTSRPYRLPGDRFPAHELTLFDPATGKQTRPAVERIDFGVPRPRWKPDGRHFTYQKVDRGHQRLRLVEVDSHIGKARDLIDEKSKTFIWTAHNESGGGNRISHLDDSDELIYLSEMDGWRHLYLYDGKAGKRKGQITRGEWVVRGIDRIDEKARQVWFRASGRNKGQDPYFIHYYRIDFDGSNLVALTEANGTHTVAFSPTRKYLIATYSRRDLPPVHELRRVSDGKLVCELERADIRELVGKGWTAPEVFMARGRDGKTDIWGTITRPRDFDLAKKYPVIEYIYAGPHSSHVPKAFSAFNRFTSLANLGFIVVQIDGMGTAHRSKAFHDVCWQNLKDAGFPDRILWHRAVAARYPWYDVTRVGIYGTSAGGQNAMGALLFHGDFYRAAVAFCGCHDNRMDKASWNEQWMGYPVGPHYAASSNVDNAHRLRGKLLLMVGEVDINVPPESTLRVVDALIRANKDFDLLVMPNFGHSSGGTYGDRRLRDFFTRHLRGVEPPDRNRAG